MAPTSKSSGSEAASAAGVGAGQSTSASSSTSNDVDAALTKARAFAEAITGAEADPAAKRQKLAGQASNGNSNATSGRSTGKAARWNQERGFGFIKPTGGHDDVFCHCTDITDGQCLVDGAAVEFDMEFEEAKGKFRARNVTGGAPAPTGAGGAVNFLSPAGQGGATYGAAGIRKCPERSMQSRMINPSRKSFFICKDIQAGTTCSHGDRCNFAHSEAEQAAWTAERDRRVQEEQGALAQINQGGFGMQGYGMAPPMAAGYHYPPAEAGQYAAYAAMAQQPQYAAAPGYNTYGAAAGAYGAAGYGQQTAAATAAPLDPATAQQVAYLEAQIKQASAGEDYMLCAQLKAQIDQLKAHAAAAAAAPQPAAPGVNSATVQQVAYLEAQIKQASAGEDYMLCAQLKAQIDQLKAQAAAAPQPAAPGVDPATTQQIVYLEAQLKAASAAEDYMLCAQLKAQLVQLKSKTQRY